MAPATAVTTISQLSSPGQERKGERREARREREEERSGARRERKVESMEGGGCTEEAEQSRFLPGFLSCHPPPRDESLVI